MYCLVKRHREIWSLHKLSLPETNVSDVWIGKLLFYRIFSNLLVARLTSQEIIKRVFNTKILSFIRALNFSHCDWRDWNVPSYWNWGEKIRTHVKLINVFFLLSNNLQQYFDKYSCLSRQGIDCHNFINFFHFQSKKIKVFVNTCISESRFSQVNLGQVYLCNSDQIITHEKRGTIKVDRSRLLAGDAGRAAPFSRECSFCCRWSL